MDATRSWNRLYRTCSRREAHCAPSSDKIENLGTLSSKPFGLGHLRRLANSDSGGTMACLCEQTEAPARRDVSENEHSRPQARFRPAVLTRHDEAGTGKGRHRPRTPKCRLLAVDRPSTAARPAMRYLSSQTPMCFFGGEAGTQGRLFSGIRCRPICRAGMTPSARDMEVSHPHRGNLLLRLPGLVGRFSGELAGQVTKTVSVGCSTSVSTKNKAAPLSTG